MTSSSQLSASSNELIQNERLLSLLLFDQIRPVCIELSEASTLQPFNTNKVVNLMISMEDILKKHHDEYNKDGNFRIYQLSPKLADYIFYPLSNILKQPALDDTIIQHLFGIIRFLVEYSWSFNVNFVLTDQLLPLVIYLSSGDLNKEPLLITKKSIQFKIATVSVLYTITSTLNKEYFQSLTEKRLLFISNVITICLSIIVGLRVESQDTIQLVLKCLSLISNVKRYLNSSQISIILPGIVSSITKFISLNLNLNYQIIIQSLRLLSGFICASFNDKELDAQIELNEGISDISEIHVGWDDDNETLDNNSLYSDVTITENDHRSSAWLKATSKQLKLSLIIIFKSILLGSRNRHRLRSKQELYDEILGFVETILKNCFNSLFKEFASLAIDIVSILGYVTSEDNKEMADKTNKLSNTLCMIIEGETNKEEVLFELIKTKLVDLIDNKLSGIVFALDEDKISSTVASMMFNFSLLLCLSRKVKLDFEDLDSLKQRCLALLTEYVADRFKFESSKPIKNSNASGLLETSSMTNQLDSIELPGYINAKGVVKQEPSKKEQDKRAYIHNLKTISRNWNTNEINNSSGNTLIGISSKFSETILQNFINYLSSLKYEASNSSTLTELENIFELADDNDMITKSTSLWVASNYYKRSTLGKVSNFDLGKYLVLDDDEDMEIDDEDMEIDDDTKEMSFLVLSRAEELLEEISENQEKYSSQTYILAYNAALQSIKVVAGSIPLDQFRTNFLMDHLLSVFQALTYNDMPEIQLQAQSTLKVVLDTYYNGSMVNLISDNLDYLIDSISLQMSVASNLTPMLPGILLIIVKIAGIQLLESNQLHDVLTDMFVILDSFHGYNKLVESFFIVFEALIDQIHHKFDSQLKVEFKESSKTNTSLYKPWGMTNKDQLLELLNESNKMVDKYEGYDSNKEYFKRKADLPFSEMDADSDDEEEDDESNIDDNGEKEEEKEEIWSSPISKDIYMILLRIFNYGFTLVSQESYTLKTQIIKTLRLLLPLLCTNYKLLLPVLASNWQMLIALVTGSKSLSTSVESNGEYASEDIGVMTVALQLVTEILEEDKRRYEHFFSKKFQEAWEFISRHSKLVRQREVKSTTNIREQKQLVVSEKAIYTFRNYPLLKTSLATFLITGVQNYEKMIPDIHRFEIIKLCYELQIPQSIPLSRDTIGVLEVLKNTT